MIVPNIHELVVEAPHVAQSVQPGNFVILRPDEAGERMPLSVADYDREKGTVTSFFQEVGESTSNLALLKPGMEIVTYAGPLGLPTEIENFGTVVMVGGCFGIGASYPAARALKEAGNRVYMVIEARAKYLVYWESRFRDIIDDVFIITRDGSFGQKGHITGLPELLRKRDIQPDRIYGNGCTFLLKLLSDVTRPMGIKTIVSMNPIMIDGTGMCGVCRLTVDGKTKFACVDGPEFDGHLIDWEEFLLRRRTYNEEEVEPLRRSGMGSEKHRHNCACV